MIDIDPGVLTADHDLVACKGQAPYPVVNPIGLASGSIRGTVRILPGALIELIDLTVRDTPGVVTFSALRRAPQAFGQPASAVANAHHFRSGGIRVAVQADQLRVDMAIVVDRNANILTVSQALRHRVGAVAGLMLGMTITDVNVHVADIDGSSKEEGF